MPLMGEVEKGKIKILVLQMESLRNFEWELVDV